MKTLFACMSAQLPLVSGASIDRFSLVPSFIIWNSMGFKEQNLFFRTSIFDQDIGPSKVKLVFHQ